jgi:methionyl-tRNA formyltransferase
MKNYFIVSEKKMHQSLHLDLVKKFPKDRWHIIDAREKFTVANLNELKPDKLFIPHWSYIIPAEIYEKYECIVFHMTDLPYGRGGSPLQNLIVRGHKETKISALRVVKGLDEGDIYFKMPLSLSGSASEIFKRASGIIFEMIVNIIEKGLIPEPQQGTPVVFKRRTKDMSDVSLLKTENEMYDYIRMLDAEGYPQAFIETNDFKFEFSNAQNESGVIFANVRITKK